MLKINIVCKLNIQGVHSWRDCDIEKVDYLKNKHRHIFYITAKKEVTHKDRDIEIITFKNSILSFLNKHYYSDKYGFLDFGGMSCEMIAEELFKMFGLNYCSVLEDNENGGEVVL